MVKQVYWGIDMSKDSLDVKIEKEGVEIAEFKVQNRLSKIIMAFSFHMARLGLSWEDCVFCMESTGVYTSILLRYLCQNSQEVYVVNPFHLKRSMGLARGKSDKIDARRIARFIAKNHHELNRYEQPCEDMVALKALQTKRKQYIKQLRQISTSTLQQKQFGHKQTVALFLKAEKPLVKAIKSAIKQVDQETTRIISSNAHLKAICKRISSVPGVGPVLSVALLVATRGFTRLRDAKQLGCYAGVVPFEHSSGTSIRGRHRVSPMADKYLKTILHMAAMRVTRLEGELRNYYLRKVAQGKNKMLVLNAIRNKIVLRVCAVIKAQKNYSPSLVLS